MDVNTSELVIPQQVASLLNNRYKDVRAEDEIPAVVIRQYVRQMVTGIPHMQWKISLVTSQVMGSRIATLLFSTPKQRSDGTSQAEHYLGEPQAGHHVGPREWWKVRVRSYSKSALLAQLYLGCPALSACSERTFLTACNVVTPERGFLCPENVNLLVFVHTNRAFRSI
ncbi:hypothetical protein PR048_018469 [Dryococelus australis]|uniref:HAT C-terminal dimerisation domain-containing protein n=1 Tax=Dryococelus australis TaxID=614101 RepID=A0ABQ9HCG1_9NEOP|nr:hypothetical protein PR048_018469 [Dryococelus australis]